MRRFLLRFRRPPSRTRQLGQVSVFVVCMWAAFTALSALVVDGGKVLNARVRAINQAEGAARAAARVLDTDEYRDTGTKVVEPTGAEAAAESYLQAYQAKDNTSLTDFAVDGDVVTVEVRLQESLAILRIAGVDSVVVHGRAEARAVGGITEEEF